MFSFQSQIVQKNHIIKFVLLQDKATLNFSEILQLWQSDISFRDFYIALLKGIPFHAFRWETPPVNNMNIKRNFEFVIVNSPELEGPAIQTYFREHFLNAAQGELVVSFHNLGKDALLIVPTPETVDSSYTHLGQFIRHASIKQNHALWQNVGQCVESACSEQPIWLNTAGGGVPWLHVRLDSRPKYYQFQPYKSFGK